LITDLPDTYKALQAHHFSLLQALNFWKCSLVSAPYRRCSRQLDRRCRQFRSSMKHTPCAEDEMAEVSGQPRLRIHLRGPHHRLHIHPLYQNCRSVCVRRLGVAAKTIMSVETQVLSVVDHVRQPDLPPSVLDSVQPGRSGACLVAE
jgi:hypothetical protein